MTAQTTDQRLHALLKPWRRAAFALGRVDCCHLAAQALQVLHGHAVALPSYHSDRTARAAFANLGADLGQVLTSMGLHQRQSGDRALVGDIVQLVAAPSLYLHASPWLSLGVVVGAARAVTTGPHGLINVPTAAWLTVWTVKVVDHG